jgi:hypothetical protein
MVEANAKGKLKGNPSWRPVTGDLLGKKPGFGYRKVRFDNVHKRLAEGWQLVEADDGQHVVVDGGNRVFGGKRVDSLAGGPGFIYMRLPDEGLAERNEFYGNHAERQIKSILPDAQRQTGEAGLRATELRIEGKGRDVKQIIE